MTDYPSNADLSAFLATHIFLWNEVHWIAAHKCYAGTRPGLATHTLVPDIVNDPVSLAGEDKKKPSRTRTPTRTPETC